MRRLNKSTNTPLGTAFFLFISLAIIPVSLEAAGLKLGFTPRLSAAVDIWTEVAAVFGPNSGAVSGSDLAALIIPDNAPSNPASDQACPPRQYACTGQVEEPSSAWTEVTGASTQAPAASRTVCRFGARARAKNKPVESTVVMTEFSKRVEAEARGFRAFSDPTVESTVQAEVLNRIGRFINSHRSDRTSIDSLSIPKSFRVLVRLKQSATSSVTGPQCKARAALDASARSRIERASLKGSPAAPDNCDL